MAGLSPPSGVFEVWDADSPDGGQEAPGQGLALLLILLLIDLMAAKC